MQLADEQTSAGDEAAMPVVQGIPAIPCAATAAEARHVDK
jgi:hypothetical protein